jgi:excisionase family DNA binding protein
MQYIFSAAPKKAPSTMQALLTEPEVADILKMSVRSVRNARMTGSLPHLRIGRLIRYRADDLDAFLGAASITPAVLGTKQKRTSSRARPNPKIRLFSDQAR